MKEKFLVFISLMFSICCISNFSYAITVGNELDLDLPEHSAILREVAVNDAMDEYEQTVKVKGSLDAEFIFNKKLHTSNELNSSELEGQYYMAKLGINILNKVEPYVKVGMVNLQASWKQHSLHNIEVDADNGFAYGGGVKVALLDFSGVRLTLDGQYRTTEPDVGAITVNGLSVKDTGATFKIDEWQATIVLGKKFEIPLKWNSIYLASYAGMSYADSNADISFRDPNVPGTDYNLFDANNKKLYGFVLGCDIMTSLQNAFLYSVELRLVNEVALSLGGTMKF